MNTIFGRYTQFAVLSIVHGALNAAEPSNPTWIGGPADAASWTASSSLALADSPMSAKLKFASDFANSTVRLNDQVVAVVAPYCQMTVLDVSNWITLGGNHIEVLVEKTEGPTAIALQLEIKTASRNTSGNTVGTTSGNTVQWMSDESWNCTADGQQTFARSLGQVRPELC